MKISITKFLALIVIMLSLCMSAHAAIMIEGSSSLITLPNGTINAEYSQSLSVDADSPWWTVSEGTLPTGLTLDSSGTLSGTPSAAGIYKFTVQAQATDETYTQPLQLIIPYPNVVAPAITTTTLTEGYSNTQYGLKLTATGTTPLTWSADNLPDGMSLTSSGYLYGTPSATGTSTITFYAANSSAADSKDFTLTIAEAPENSPALLIKDDPYPAYIGQSYTLQLLASGTPPFTWTMTGKTPSGLKMSSSGLVTGTPKSKGAAVLKVTVSNDIGSSKTVLKVKNYEAPQITSDTLKDAILNRNYNATVGRKGTMPLTWIMEGTLPDGIEFDSERGKFSGTPTTPGIGMVRLTLRNPVGEVSKVYMLNAGAILPAITPKTLKNGTHGKAYKVKVKAKGTTPITLSLSGDLPAGLTFDASTGVIEGTPTETCTNRPIRITAANAGGNVETRYSLTIKAVPPKITTKKISDGTIDTPYSAQIEATGTAPFTWTASGLPSGLSIGDDGVISGTPSRYGKFTAKVTAKNAAKSASKNYKLNVLSAPVFDEKSSTLTSGKEGSSYRHVFNVKGYDAITYSISGGSLPQGMSLNANTGILRGKPKESGTFNFTVTATNSAGTASMEFSLRVIAKTIFIKGTSEARTGIIKTAPESEGYAIHEGIGSGTEGYVIAAVLPEVSVDVSGMYDFSAELSPDINEGAELLWLAGRQEHEDDDDIAEFFDDDGQECGSMLVKCISLLLP